MDTGTTATLIVQVLAYDDLGPGAGDTGLGWKPVLTLVELCESLSG